MGGLVGGNTQFAAQTGTISESSAGGDVSGHTHVGGLVGAIYYSGINASTASGSVSGRQVVGGIVGYISSGAVISDVTANGAVSGRLLVGGLAGASRGEVIGGTANGVVSGGVLVAGLVGGNYSGIIGESMSNGDIRGVYYVGGLVGSNTGKSTINGSVAGGEVTGAENVGGLVGYNAKDSSVRDSNSSGNVSGVTYRGALVGVNDGGTIDNSEGVGTVTLNQDPPLEDMDALAAFWEALLGDADNGEYNLTSILTEVERIDFFGSSKHGVFIDAQGRVTRLEPTGCRGEISTEIGNLTNLEYLDLSRGQLQREQLER